MKNVRRMAVALAILVLATAGYAGNYTYEPSPRSDLYDLTHQKAYLWGIAVDIPGDEEIIGAAVHFDNIRNWRTESNDLYLNLIDDASEGVTIYTDNQNPSNYFQSWGLLLHHYEDLSATAQDLTYEFEVAEIDQLADDAADGVVALGFDPDCHFYNCGVTFEIETYREPGGGGNPPIPEPLGGTILAAGIGLLARRRRRT
jgi:hypothetical protein